MKASLAGDGGHPRVTSMPKPPGTGRKANEARKRPEIWSLRLYVAGSTPRALLALTNLKVICNEHLSGRYRIEVIDLLKRPKHLRGDQILALPALVRRLPRPLCHLVGDLSDTERVLVGLDLARTTSRS
jgi:circadian clock protein KaiB